MKLLLIPLLFLFCASLLHAEAKQQKIILSSFVAEKDAHDALDRLDAFISNYPEIVALSDREGFMFTTRPSGKYHILVVEPFKDPTTLQRVKSLLQTRYTSLFVNRYTPPSREGLLFEAAHPSSEASAYATAMTETAETDEVASARQSAPVTEKVSELTSEEPLQEAKTHEATFVATETPSLDELPATAAGMPSPVQAVSNDGYIFHNPVMQPTQHSSSMPPWWVILSVIILIAVPLNDFVQSRRARIR